MGGLGFRHRGLGLGSSLGLRVMPFRAFGLGFW